METVIDTVSEVTPSVCEAFARLGPQLSARLGAPSAERLWRICSSPASALLAARRGAEIVGLLTLVWYDAPSGRKAWIEDVVVDAAARGCGAGEALVRAALARARQVGADRVMLTSSAARTAARNLYRKVGFEEAETTVFALKTEEQ